VIYLTDTSGIGQPQGIAPTKNQMHGENNRGRPCACPLRKMKP